MFYGIGYDWEQLRLNPTGRPWDSGELVVLKVPFLDQQDQQQQHHLGDDG